MKNTLTLELEKVEEKCLSNLQSVILLNNDNVSRFYYIPSGILSPEKLMKYSFQLAYPINKFADDAGINPNSLYRFLRRKNAMLRDPSTGNSWFCLCDYELEKFFNLRVNFNYHLDEEQLLKNVFGYITPESLSKLFPWINFDNALIKFLCQPWLNVIEAESTFYFMLTGDPFNPYDIHLGESDICFLYHNLLINKNALAVIKKISPDWAIRAIRERRFKKIRGGLRYMYAKVDSLVTYADFFEYVEMKYSFKPFEGYLMTSVLHKAMDLRTMNAISEEVLDDINQHVIKPVRENLDLKVKLILKTKGGKNGNNCPCTV